MQMVRLTFANIYFPNPVCLFCLKVQLFALLCSILGCQFLQLQMVSFCRRYLCLIQCQHWNCFMKTNVILQQTVPPNRYPYNVKICWKQIFHIYGTYQMLLTQPFRVPPPLKFISLDIRYR